MVVNCKIQIYEKIEDWFFGCLSLKFQVSGWFNRKERNVFSQSSQSYCSQFISLLNVRSFGAFKKTSGILKKGFATFA